MADKKIEKVSVSFIDTPYDGLVEAMDSKEILKQKLVQEQYDPVPIVFSKNEFKRKDGTTTQSYTLDVLLHRMVKIRMKSQFVNESTYNMLKLALNYNVDLADIKLTGFVRFLKGRSGDHDFTAIEVLLHPDIVKISSYVDGASLKTIQMICGKSSNDLEKMNLEPFKTYKIYKLRESQASAIDLFEASFDSDNLD